MTLINCLIFGDKPHDVFPIEIDRNIKIMDLKSLIKKEMDSSDTFPARNLDLWQVDISSGDIELLQKWLPTNQPLQPMQKVDISKIECKDNVHFIIVKPSMSPIIFVLNNCNAIEKFSSSTALSSVTLRQLLSKFPRPKLSTLSKSCSWRRSHLSQKMAMAMRRISTSGRSSFPFEIKTMIPSRPQLIPS
jgi:hypothetical protein